MNLDASNTPRTRRAKLCTLLTGNRTRDAALTASIARLVAAGLSSCNAATFGLFNRAVGDNSCSITATLTVLTSPNNPWTSADVGKAIDVAGAGAAGATLRSQIVGYTSAGSVTLKHAAGTTVAASKTSAGGLAVWGWLCDTADFANPIVNTAGDPQRSSRIIAKGTTAARSEGDRLGEWMDVTDFGMDPTGVNDSAPGWALAMASDARNLRIPPGNYIFNSQPARIGQNKQIVGSGWFFTDLICNYAIGATDTFIRGAGNGCMKQLTISKAAGTNAGYALAIVSDDNYISDWEVLEDILIRGNLAATSTWKRCFYATGIDRTSDMGVRDLTLRNVAMIDATEHTAYVENAINFAWTGGGVYTGAGAVALLTLTGSAGHLNTRCEIAIPGLAGTLAIAWANEVHVGGNVSSAVTVDANSTNVLITAGGGFTPPPTTAATSVCCYKPDGVYKSGNSTWDVYVNGGKVGSFSQGGAAATSYVTFRGSTAGTPTLEASGAAADIDLRLTPKGTGMVRIGVATADAVDSVTNGYVTVKDQAGNVVKLLTRA